VRRLAQAWSLRSVVLSRFGQTALYGLVRSSAIYALAAIASPLTSLVLAPFLTRQLSAGDYGLLVVLNTAIGLLAGITQLGLSSAFFRAYNYDYSTRRDKASVVATAFGLLIAIAVIAVAVTALIAGLAGNRLSGRASSDNLVVLAIVVVIVQNLALPAFAWMRAEGRSVSFALVSIINVAVTLTANVVLVGVLHRGVAGSLIATASGYAAVILATAPALAAHMALPRIDIARSMLSFGVPQVPNVLALWVLQLSDRYLLAQLRSLDETARYAVAYSLGMAVSIVVVSPFALAWPTAMYAIAKREDARDQFRLVFTAACLTFLFIAYALSLVGVLLLDRLFSNTYHSAAPVIPLVSESLALSGMYMLLTIGIGLTRKTWVASALTLSAAVANVLINLLLIPRFGALGAAISTLLAYAGLVAAAYLVNQRLYPLDLPIGRLVAAVAIGMVLYWGSYQVGMTLGPQWILPGQLLGLAAYCGCLVFLGASTILPLRRSATASIPGSSANRPTS